MPFTIEQAIPEHAAAIAKIFLSDETSDFLRLQLGTVDPAILNGGLTERLAVSIKRPRETYIIARDDETQEIVSYAQWILPRDAMDVVVGQTVDVSSILLTSLFETDIEVGTGSRDRAISEDAPTWNERGSCHGLPEENS